MSRFLRHPRSPGARWRPGRSSSALTGPAGAPPGHHLRSGDYMAATKKRGQSKISPIEVSTLSGEPRLGVLRARPRTVLDILTMLCKQAVSLELLAFPLVLLIPYWPIRISANPYLIKVRN